MALSTPDSDQRTFRDTSHTLRLIVICILSVTVMVLDNNNEHLRDVRRLMSAAAHPIRVTVDAPFALVRWIRDSTATRDDLHVENRRLRDENLIQRSRLQRQIALEAENARLRGLLDSTAKISGRVLIGEILSVDMNPFRHRITINRGSSDELYVGQALIDADGIIGQIVRDQIYSAEALLITDIDHATPVEILRNRLRTIAVGTGDFERLSLPFLPRNADITVGDAIVTSGLGGTFPPGYPVGVVTEVTGDTGEPFLTITATPAASLNRIREVLMVWPAPALAEAEPPVESAIDSKTNGAGE
ncbi:MAG: rod shape-determining protein MreC [Gammaproteobacteria bacterium]|nr:rod shape-determining protein MreC [Gammaproteobacteria bacterium]